MADSPAAAEMPKTLEFDQCGWCRTVEPPIRYERGVRVLRSREEYEALKPFAKG